MSLVAARDLERSLARVERETVDPQAGLFGPGSRVWDINRHTVVFIGAGRAALLQLAHPWVAQAIADHSSSVEDPMGRFRRTFRHVFAMVWGDLEHALVAARSVHAIHTKIAGPLRDTRGGFGDRYRACDVDALVWVHATLWDTSMQVFELLERPLETAEKDAYIAETARFARLFGVPDGALPTDWDGFRSYNQRIWAELEVSPAAAEIAAFLFRPPAPGLSGVMSWYRNITAGLMPEVLRPGFDLRFESREQARFERSVRLLRGWRRLPGRLRYLPPYWDALHRLEGGRAPGPLGRLLNRALVGTPRPV